MAGHLRCAIHQVKRRAASRLPIDVDRLAAAQGHLWRDRTLTPAVTVWLFLLQVLHGNCAITALRHVGGIAMRASSYCAARQRLPLTLFASLFDAMSHAAAQAAGVVMLQPQSGRSLLMGGRRVLLADVTTFSMPDTPALRQHFGYPPGQRPGLGFPIGKLLGIIDALSGCVLVALGCPLFSHEAREMLALHPLLRAGDVLIADRGFCSYAQIALLAQQGVAVVMRLHQRRAAQVRGDVRETWTRPPQRPAWMSNAQWQQLPEQIHVRIVRYPVNRRNGRTRQVYIATTLLDPIAHPPRTIQQLYGHRWHIETCFNQLKTHAGMNTLKSQTVAGVIKELIMYLIVWNLVRLTMLRSAQRAGVPVWRVSFIDTVRGLCRLLQPARPRGLDVLLNPDRPDRWEPRKRKRRMKEYDLLKEPRASLKAKHRARCG